MTLLVTVNGADCDQTGAADVKGVIALVGLAIEARIAGTAAMIADGDRTGLLLRNAIRQGARGIMSFGVCGGLDPKLRPGKIVIASSVFAGKSEAYPTDLRWAEKLLRMIPDSGYFPIAGVASCRKKYLAGLVAVLQARGLRLVSAEPAPFALFHPIHNFVPFRKKCLTPSQIYASRYKNQASGEWTWTCTVRRWPAR